MKLTAKMRVLLGLALALCFALAPCARAQVQLDPATVVDFAQELQDLIDDGESVIEILGDPTATVSQIYSVDDVITIPSGANVTIRAGLDPFHPPQEIILSETGEQEPVHFPLLDSGGSAVGCASITLSADETKATITVEYDTADIPNADVLEILDATDTLVDASTTWDVSASPASPITVTLTIDSAVIDPADLTLGIWTLRLTDADGTTFIEGVMVPDGYCLDLKGQAGTATGAMIEVEDGATLTLQGLTLQAKNVAVRALAGSELNLAQCYIRDCGGTGVEYLGDTTDGQATGVLTSCSIVRNGIDGVAIEEGTVTIFQCSFLDNLEAGVRAENDGSAVDISACLFYNNTLGVDGGADFANNTTIVLTENAMFDNGTDHNLPDVAARAAATPGVNGQEWSDLANLASSGALASMFLNGSWRGALVDSTLTIYMVTDPSRIDPAAPPVDNISDFEYDDRAVGAIYVGADEEDFFASGTPAWFNCAITTSPSHPLYSSAPVAGAGDTVRVQIITRNLDLLTIPVEVLVVRQGGVYTTATDLLHSQLLTPVSSISGYTTFTIPTNDNSFDGLASIYLLAQDGSNTLFGAPEGTGYVFRQAETNRFFLIDTIAPKINIGNLPSGYKIFATNDASTPPNQGFPSDWAPGPAGPTTPATPGNEVPESLGTMADPHIDPQVFFNVPGDPTVLGRTLDFSLAVEVTDEGTGFTTAQPAMTFNGQAGIELGLFSPRGLSNGRPEGTVWWGSANPAASAPGDQLFVVQPNTATLGLSHGYNTSGTTPVLEAEWIFTGLLHTGNEWQLTAEITAQDLAGNETAFTRLIHMWWMPTDLYGGAVITASPGGNAAVDPVIGWDIGRLGGQGPQDSYPCFPIAYFRLVRVNANGTSALLLTSPWIREHTIDRFTVVVPASGGNPPVRLGDILDNPANLNRQMAVVIAAADEAGNVQNINDPNLPPAVATWINTGQSALLDTSVQTRLWHNDTTQGNLATIDPAVGEIDFGSSARVPLTSSTLCAQRVEAAFQITAGTSGAESGKTYISWELFEDGRLVAHGNVSPDLATKRATLVVPTIFITPSANPSPIPDLNGDGRPDIFIDLPFLNASSQINCNGTQDRLGDDGDPPVNRQRDVEYLFTARTVVRVPDTTVPFRDVPDLSPASSSFTVYTDREVGNTEPIKSFDRE